MSAKWLVRASFRHNCPSFVPRAICTGGPHRPHVAGFLGDSGCIAFGGIDLRRTRSGVFAARTPQQLSFERKPLRLVQLPAGWSSTRDAAVPRPLQGGLHAQDTRTLAARTSQREDSVRLAPISSTLLFAIRLICRGFLSVVQSSGVGPLDGSLRDNSGRPESSP